MNWFTPKPSVVPRRLVAIRMDAIGGQGANSAGKILSDAAVSGLGYTGSHFASFGSEKRGSPVQSFVRFSPERVPVRSAFFSTPPDLIVIFHEAMIDLHPSSLTGANDSTILIVNSPKRPSELHFPIGTKLGKIFCVDAGAISRKEKCGLNAVMLGAILLATPELEQKSLEMAMKNFFRHLSEKAKSRNLSGLWRGFSQAGEGHFLASQAVLPALPIPLPRLGWENAPMGGIVVNPGNTALRDHSLSRQGFAPRFDSGECINCGYCDMVCPDYCFVWGTNPANGAPLLQGIDYQFCKGCQKCISICPSDALSLAVDSEIPLGERRRKFPDLDPSALEKKWQSVDWNVHYSDDEDER